MEKLSKDSVLLLKILNNANASKEIDNSDFFNSFIACQVYNSANFELEFWDKNTYYLHPEAINNINTISYREIGQDNFLLSKVKYNNKNIIFWFNLSSFITSELDNSIRFFHRDDERKEYIVLGYKEANSLDFVDSQDNFLFSIKRAIHANDLWIIIGLLVIIIATFFYLRLLYFLTKPLTRVYPIIGCLVFVGLVYTTRKLLLFYKLPSIFYSLKLFNPSLYSSDVTPSLGDLFLFVFSTQIILYYLQENLILNLKRWENTWIAFIIHTAALIFLLGESFSINKIFERMVVESSIWFNFDYFPRLTIYSFIGLGIMLMTFSNYYLLSNLILKTIYNFKLSKKRTIVSFLIFITTVILLGFVGDFRFEIKLTFVLLLFFITIFYSRYYFNIKNRIFSFGVFLFFASFTTTFLLSRYNLKKEEVILSSIATNVTFGLDKVLEKKMLYLLESNNSDSLNSYLSSFRGIEFHKIDELEYQKWIDSRQYQSKELLLSNESAKLFLVHSNSIRQYLIQQKLGNVYHYMIVNPKTHLSNIANSTKEAINEVIIRENKISYGLYLSDTLLEQSGPYRYKKRYPYSKANIKFTDEQFGLDFDHFAFTLSDVIKVLVTIQKANPVSILSQFSYIFCINFILAIFLFLIVWSLRITYISEPFFHFNELRTKIVLAIFLLVISIFIGITILSFNSLKSRFTIYNKETSYNNLKVTKQAIEQIYSTNLYDPLTDLNPLFKKLKGISLLDYDLYDQGGKLIQSSETDIKNMDYPKLLDPRIFFHLRSNDDIQFNTRKGLEDAYLESFAILGSKISGVKYYIALTSQNGKGSQNEEMRLIVVLINLYVLVFLISLVFAIWLANRITKPLQTLTEKISNLGLARKNEYLEYIYQDEIGELVKRYNIMVDEIQESARILAEQQREEAWSEMAKQIAHEIKNPLTPMKLKIQFLQKKLKEGHSNIESLVSSTAVALIEQIDNLDSIATAFSSYARLHTPQLEIMDWKSIIQSSVELFKSRNVEVNFYSHIDKAIVNCDRNQMTSVLNNLIKNAIQAYDEDDALVNLKLRENQSFYFLEIEDFGKGISEEEKDRIFVPNFTTKSSGSGLGLAIVKKIVTTMNGNIWFSSELGKGTKFYVSLPKQIENNDSQFTPREEAWLSMGFVKNETATILEDLSYRFSDNVFSKVLYSDFDKSFLHEITYHKLIKASEFLNSKNSNYRLVIKDALRPFEVQKMMWDLYQGDNKLNFIAPPDKDSMHNYGMAVDIWLVEVFTDAYTPNQELDMGCEFDEFSERAHFDYENLTEAQRSNRTLLREVMRLAGFIAYDHEFWHFEAMHKDWVRENCVRV